MSEKIVCTNCLTEHVSEFSIKPNDKRTFQGKCKKCNNNLKFKINNYNSKGLLEKDSISFSINGETYTVNNPQYPFTMTLNDYIRNVLHKTGTKVTCREGGCGACVINAEMFDQLTQELKNVSINTCLFPLYSCDGIKFTTIEGVGSKTTNFSEIQKRLVDKNGTQCGWCTPGMVMNMYNLLLNNPKPMKAEIENAFDGNICRCTGYRSIMDAMKSFAADENPIDIEELNKLRCLSGKGQCKNAHILRKADQKDLHVINDDLNEWFAPEEMDELLSLLDKYKSNTYRLVSGNTGVGVFKNDGPYEIFIDVKKVKDLYSFSVDSTGMKLGSQLTLKTLIDKFNSNASSVGYEYLTEIANHINKIANRAVRNTGSWAGNLAMKHAHLEFPSDIFICFETIGAKITLIDNTKQPAEYSPLEFLQQDLKGRLIESVKLVPYDAGKTFIKTFKIMPRSANAHAYVNAGFKFEIDPNSYQILSKPTIVFGGISVAFTHAFDTETFLIGKNINNKDTLKTALDMLSKEIKPDNDPVLATPEYRKSLALSLFYKFLLYVNQNNIDVRNKSALDSVIDNRPISSGQQSFPTNPEMFPISKPMPKLNALLQASGEAEYVFDRIPFKNQLEGAFILSKRGACRIDKIDATTAKQMPGVVKILFAEDIPGENTFVSAGYYTSELLFCYDQVDYAGQPIGLVVAETLEQAQNAAKQVSISYKEEKTPILNILDAIKQNSFFPKPLPDIKYGDAEEACNSSPNVIDGDIYLDTQFHFNLETHNAVSHPSEDGLTVHSATQSTQLVQDAVAALLGVRSNSITVKVKQLGGSYGTKISRANRPACASALAAKICNRPVRVSMDLNTALEAIGKRFPWYAKYRVGFDKVGNIRGIILDLYCDGGNSPNDNSMAWGAMTIDNTYNVLNWLIKSNVAKTNLPANTATRSTFPAISIIESLMEHVAKYLKVDPLRVRLLNFYQKGGMTPYGQPLPYFNADTLISQLKVSSDYANRSNEIADYNKNNRWKKRGLSLTPIKWTVGYLGKSIDCSISIYSSDGSIIVSHGGIEMGQGIHTKVAQVCAYFLNRPLETILVKYSDSVLNPNALVTGGSTTTELISEVAISCCKQMNERLDPIKKIMPSGYTWSDLIKKADSMGVDLTSRSTIVPQQEYAFKYFVYGAACSEAIVDVLTGETQILRTDILYDAGDSMNGEIDIGQTEGAFVMGLGYWLYEKVRYDPETGACLSNGTWEYKPPLAKDIPVDFRVTLLSNNPNPLGVLGAKCISEPPLCLTPSVAFAVKRAIESARSEINQDTFFPLNSPATVESIQTLCQVDYTQFTF